MTLLKRLNAPFVLGAIAASCFLGASMLDVAPVGIGLVCLIGGIEGALPRRELITFVAGMLAMMVVFSGLGLLAGNSISAGLVMVPLLTALILLYALGAFFLSLMVSRLWRRFVSRPSS